MRRLERDAAELAFDPDPQTALSILQRYVPPDDAQAHTRARIVAFLLEHHDALRRTCPPGHLTASALVRHPDGERALLLRHRKLGRWLQPGGHCDGDANLPAVALREAFEESGIEGLCVRTQPIDLDVHGIPARKGEPEHLHLDVRFLVEAPEGAEPTLSDESTDWAWVRVEELAGYGADASVERLFRVGLG